MKRDRPISNDLMMVSVPFEKISKLDNNNVYAKKGHRTGRWTGKLYCETQQKKTTRLT